MRICILCEDSKVQSVRETAKSIFTRDVLQSGLSSDGKLPITHWYCCLTITDETYQKIILVQKDSIIEESDPINFLSKWKLKPVLKS